MSPRPGEIYWLMRMPEVRKLVRDRIAEALGRNAYNQCRAAKELGVHRNTLRRVMAELKIRVNP